MKGSLETKDQQMRDRNYLHIVDKIQSSYVNVNKNYLTKISEFRFKVKLEEKRPYSMLKDSS